MTVAALALGASATAASPAATVHRAPKLRKAPTISGKSEVGAALLAHPGRWAGANSLGFRWERCNRQGAACKTIRHTKSGRPNSGRTYQLSSADRSHRIRVVVTARNRWGHDAATSRATGVIAAAGALGGTSTSPGGSSPGGTAPGGGGSSPGGGSVDYFATVPSSQTGAPPAGIPRSDATCAAAVQPAAEVVPQNATANHTVPSSPSDVDWGTALNYWTKWVNDYRNAVTGGYTGTTDEILQWVSCKWGIDVNLIRADAWVESRWVQSLVAGGCGSGASEGEGSYGILQVTSKDCSGDWVIGGWPYVQDDTALDADIWGARLRACFDGAFYNGGSWLYNGQTIAQVIAQNGEDYAMWGCIGSWYSGHWYDSGAQSYIATVQSAYASEPWRSLGS
jgi:hypothetical protein